ncbi:MAG: sigma-70 family RNA polymerase sigma factor [Deltaproteobacteria bacterium]|nr:sigma-70 family RNA polymerase sigma factor [Deltaproteobacteria bacterium]
MATISDPNSSEITLLLRRWSQGEESAAEEVLPLIYDQLHSIATAYFSRERGGHTLQPTGVVHEAFLRLVKGPVNEWEDRSHFFGIAARLMRQVLVDHARQRNREKRGGGVKPISLTDTPEHFAHTAQGVLAVDQALTKLRLEDPQKASVVEMRFFGGLTNEEIAGALRISTKTVSREWRRARAHLFLQLSAET